MQITFTVVGFREMMKNLHSCVQLTKRCMTSFILETNSGIFKLQPATMETKVNMDAQTVSDFNMLAENHSYLSLFIPRDRNLSPSIENIKLNRLCKRLENFYPGVSTGYISTENSFRKIIKIRSPTPVETNNDLCDKVVFKLHKNGVTLLDCPNSVCSISEKNFEVRKHNDQHPLFEHAHYVAVQNTFNDVIETLKQLSGDDELKITVEKLLDEASKIDVQKLHNVTRAQLKNPFIVVEGLDGTGKSTMINNIAKHFDVDVIRTPPSGIASSRKIFNKLPELCRRSFYYLGNYIAADQVMKLCKEKAVLVDRYWYSTVAYAIANQSVTGVHEHLPNLDHPVYSWPVDLLRPNAVIFLSIPEETRDDRVNQRTEMTAEEKKMKIDRDFKSRIMEVYKRLRHENWIDVITSGTQEESLNLALQGLRRLQILK